MKYYIATRLENHVQHNALRDLLNGMGHSITYDWTLHGPVWKRGIETIRQVAANEENGIHDADVVFVLLPGGRGTHVELGMAIAVNTSVIIWSSNKDTLTASPETCAFYHSNNVRHASDTIESLAEMINDL
jgi:nucleoside 2-deoxyribosyltransferase